MNQTKIMIFKRKREREGERERGYYTVARRYGFYLGVHGENYFTNE